MNRRGFLHAVLGAFAMRFAPQLPAIAGAAAAPRWYRATKIIVVVAGKTLQWPSTIANRDGYITAPADVDVEFLLGAAP